jgi:hypothetical protein
MQTASRPNPLTHISFLPPFGLLIVLAAPVRGDFVPIALTPDTFNQDMIVERTAPAPLLPASTASMEAGFANTGTTFYERGYVPDYPSTGLYPAGSIISSQLRGDYAYQLAPNYRSNNAILLDSITTAASLTLDSPTACAGLSFLTCSSAGSGTIRYTLHHQDGSSQNGTFVCPHWFNAFVAAYTAAGRVDTVAFTVFDLNASQPNLCAADITVNNAVSPVTSIDLAYASGSGHHAVFAVSGILTPGDGATPLAVTGFNADLVVEATAARSGYLSGFTTAAMGDGAANKGFSWYEQGYNRAATNTGLPAPGSTINSALSSDHRYAFASTYAGNNVVMIDSSTTGLLTPTAPSAFATLSFLGAAAQGPSTNGCLVTYLDGSTETNWFVFPDWMDNAPAAFIADGRVRISTKALDSVNNGSPRLFSADITLANSTSPISNVVVTVLGASSTVRTAIFGMSGSTTVNHSSRPTLTITHGTGSALTITSSAPGRLQSTTSLEGVPTVWQDEGAIVSTVTVTPDAGQAARFYRVVVP